MDGESIPMLREEATVRSRPALREETAWLQKNLHSAVAVLCPPSLAEHREDIVQEAMLKVLRVVEKSPPDRTFNASYLWQTAYCALVDELRRLRRREEVGLEEADPHGAMHHPAPGPHSVARGNEIRQAIEACLEGLIRQRKLAVILHLQGESPRDSAEILGWGRKRVYNLIARGLKDLRGCLKTKGVKP